MPLQYVQLAMTSLVMAQVSTSKDTKLFFRIISIVYLIVSVISAKKDW